MLYVPEWRHTAPPASNKHLARPFAGIEGSTQIFCDVIQMLQLVNLSVKYWHFHRPMCPEQQMPADDKYTCHSFFFCAECEYGQSLQKRQYGQFRKGYYKSIGTLHYFLVNEFVVICGKLSGAIRLPKCYILKVLGCHNS